MLEFLWFSPLFCGEREGERSESDPDINIPFYHSITNKKYAQFFLYILLQLEEEHEQAIFPSYSFTIQPTTQRCTQNTNTPLFSSGE